VIWELAFVLIVVMAWWRIMVWATTQDRKSAKDEVAQFKEGVEEFLKHPMTYRKGNGNGK
jgi:hypothetical protein